MARSWFWLDPNVPDEVNLKTIRSRLGSLAVERRKLQAPIQVVKRDEPKNLVFGWANVAFTPDGQQVLDHQGHMFDVDDLESGAYDFTVKYGLSGDMHEGEGFGELVESMVFTPEKLAHLGLEGSGLPVGWWVGFRVPPEHREAVERGERTMFSIEGTAVLEEA